MKTFVKIFLISSLISMPVFAASDHEHKSMNRSEPSSKHAVTDKKAGHLHKAVYRSAPLSAAQKNAVHQHLEKMQALMVQIKNEKDAEKHEILMKKHMKLMHQCTHVMTHGEGEMPLLNMEEKMIMMEDHMSMMQMMMGQMMEHQSQAEVNKPAHQHKK